MGMRCYYGRSGYGNRQLLNKWKARRSLHPPRPALSIRQGSERREAGPNWKRQLAAYALLLEESCGLPVQRGVFYYLPTRRAQEVVIGSRLRSDVRQNIVEIQEMITRERMPGPPKSRQPCVDCEFRRFCNDVL